MTSYVDVETSAEALQEDEELIEAVEHIVEKAAGAIYTDLQKEVHGVYEICAKAFAWLFPFWLRWRQDPAFMWEDMGKTGLFFIICGVAFWFLGPSSRWQSVGGGYAIPRIRSQHATGSQQATSSSHNGVPLVRGGIFRRSSSSLERFGLFQTLSPWRRRRRLRSGWTRGRPLERSRSASSIDAAWEWKGTDNDDEDEEDDIVNEEDEQEETEYSYFAKRWPWVVQAAPYRNLVLPPECRRVDKPKQTTSKKATEVQASHQTEDEVDEEENPYQRLSNYFNQFLHLCMKFLRYDYVGAGWTLIHWVEATLRSRNRATREDDDESTSSSVVRRLSFPNTGSGPPSPTKEATGKDRCESTSGLESKRHNLRSKRDAQEKGHRAPIMQELVEEDDGAAHDHPEVGSAVTPVKAATTNFRMEEGDDTSTTDTSDPVSHSSLAIDVGLTEGQVHHKEEEKKEPNDVTSTPFSSLPTTPTQTSGSRSNRSGSISSLYETPRVSLKDELDPGGGGNVAEAVAAKLALHVQQQHNGIRLSASGSKTKDALDSYRTRSVTSASGTPLPHLPPLNERVQSPLGGGRLQQQPRRLMERNESGEAYYFETVSTKEHIQKMNVDVPVPDKNGFILGDEFLPSNDWTPLLVFVNSRSGPQQGHLLITQLRGLLNPMQVWDLAEGGPEEVLESFSVFTRLRILVCGGDGTVSWIVSTIEKMDLHRWPPIAILPLGTGNDLARIHGWGGGYNNESLVGILEQVAESYISWLDRWEMTVETKKRKVKEVKSFFNYLGVGADAQAALQVHLLRESRPQLFFSRVVNKAWYGIFGAEDLVKATSVNLPHEITLIADGVEVPLPKDSQGIILLNIDSYAGGVPLWSLGSKSGSSGASPMGSRTTSYSSIPMKRSKSLDAIRSLKSATPNTGNSTGAPLLDRIDSVEGIASMALTDEEKYMRVTGCDRPSSCQDGYLDVVSIRGAFHLGQIKVGLSNAQKICQCREATIVIKKKVSVQIDGEPWRQNTCTLRVKRKKHAAIMLHRSESESNGVETEMAKLLDWAEERQVINSRQHDALMKEFSRRIESKTRQRRATRSQDNIMFSLKRAMANTGNMKGGTPNGIMF